MFFFIYYNLSSYWVDTNVVNKLSTINALLKLHKNSAALN